MALGRMVFGVAVLWAGVVSAQEADDAARCVGLTDDAARLACYDAVFGVDAAPAVAVAPVGMGAWVEDVDVSALTDETNVFVALTSSDDIPGQFSGRGPARMVLRCMENTTAVLLSFNGQFMSDIQGYGRVEYRLDEDAMQRVSMTASTDNKALGLWRGRQAIPFIKRMLGHERMVVRVTPYNESPITMTFPISGVDQAVVKLRETCGW